MQTTMQALSKHRAEPGIWLVSAPVPRPGTNEVLVKIHITGICGTDLHIYNWDGWAQRNIQVPRIIGHEFVGEIVAIGDGVDRVYSTGQLASDMDHAQILGTDLYDAAGHHVGSAPFAPNGGLIGEAGFHEPGYRLLSFGIAALHWGTRR